MMGKGRESYRLPIPNPSDADVDVGGTVELQQELVVVATRGRGNNDVEKVGLRVEGDVGDEELFGINGLVERDAKELDVVTEEEVAGGAEGDGANVILGDWEASEDLGRGE
ncbi:hypothetical protein Syun_023282 [Stephania yunnanensis]|uniref:Uncharacterized protein n=1 Tax=Stephania yunnanensis TaxID=152371 RepID=A0AAP0F8Q7_9MAGN